MVAGVLLVVLLLVVLLYHWGGPLTTRENIKKLSKDVTIYILFRFIYKYIYVRNYIGVEIDAAIPLPRPIIMRALRYDAYLEQTKFPIAERLAACLHGYPDHGCMFYPQEILSHVPSLKLSYFGYKNRLLLEWLRGRFYVSFSERFCNYTCSQAH